MIGDVRVAMLLSGGVDSSVALARLVEQGHDVTAFYLKVWLEDELSYLGECPWEEDLDFARRVCDRLDVPLEVRSLQKEYWDRVVSYTLDELQAGRTPSPDVFCNQRIKFGAFFDVVDDGFERVATGHYARIDRSLPRPRLLTSPDPVKDQTYFLSHLLPHQLERATFPIGDLLKSDVRALAARLDLPTQSRKDSQGICFLGRIHYREFVRHHLGESEGDVVELESGRTLGRHRGHWFHTIGQRQGLGLSGGPWYVHSKDPDSNTVVVVHGDRRADRARHEYQVERLHWIGAPPSRPELEVKLRHGPKRVAACVQLSDGGASVRLEEADPGVAPGQITVFYDGEWCLGGATISADPPCGPGGTRAPASR